MARLQQYGFTLRKEKCEFGVQQVLWFEHIFSKEGMSPDPEKVNHIRNWPPPKDKSEVKSFLQTVQFCAAYMRPGGSRTEPLRVLTNKNVWFKWTKECQKSFEELKSLLCSSTVLANYELHRKTRLYVDHGPFGVASTKTEQNYSKVEG